MQEKKPINWLYSASLVIPLLAIIGNLFGAYWTLGVPILIVILTIPDIFLKYSNKKSLGSEVKFNNLLLITLTVVNTLVLVSLLYGIRESILVGIFLWLGVFSSSIAMGAIGNVTAHELIHRRSKIKLFGIWNLFLVSYTHYAIEHIQFHHRYVATDLDPSTAKKNENFYAFEFRLIPSQFAEVWEYEKARLSKKSKSAFDWDNFMVKAFVAKVVFMAIVLFYAGLMGAVAYLIVCIISRLIHDTITYSQHYGSKRELNGKITIMHSWQSNSLVSEYFSLALIRHSDHHWHTTYTYPNLVSYHKAPTLPFGYMAALPLVWIPPLWFRIMNPILDRIEGEKEVG